MSINDNNEYLANLTDKEKKEIKKRVNSRLQDTKQELKNNLDQITAAKREKEKRAFECICRTILEENIKRLQREAVITEIMISELRNHCQNLEQEESLPNKIEEKKRKEANKRLIEGINARIVVKKQHYKNILSTLREKEKSLEEKVLEAVTVGCKCKADLIKKIAALEDANTIIELEIKLLTKYYQDEKLLTTYYESILLD